MDKQNGIQRIHATGIQKQQADSKLRELYEIVKHVNQLVSYPMSGQQIEDWCRSLLHLMPELDLNALIYLINQMKLGTYTYDRNLGIQNICIGLNKIRKTRNGYYIDHTEKYY